MCREYNLLELNEVMKLVVSDNVRSRTNFCSFT